MKALRQQRHLSQERLADLTGLSLRTIQRAESGQRVGYASLRTLAAFFEISIESLEREAFNMHQDEELPAELPRQWPYHGAVQLIIFVIIFFVCCSQWLAYWARVNPVNEDASLWTILGYVSYIAMGAAFFAVIFARAKVLFFRSYYVAVTILMAFAITIEFWTRPFADSASYFLVTPVFFSVMLAVLCIFHVLQLALSLQNESVIYVQEGNFGKYRKLMGTNPTADSGNS